MADSLHPASTLFVAEKPFPVLPAVDHYAGTETFMRKALALQAGSEVPFDVTLDLEDGAPAGREVRQAELVVEMLRSRDNVLDRAGVRIHDHGSPFWRDDVESVLRGAGERVAHLTIPKTMGARQLAEMITFVQNACANLGVRREIPLHVLIETHEAVADVFKIASLPWLRTLEFGIMDFVSAHHGAVPAEAMESPLQFDHVLLRRAKTRLVAAALAHGLVPVHNVTTDVSDPSVVAADAIRARNAFGFLRMWSIHPMQIAPIVEAFAPRTEEIGRAAAILLAGRGSAWAPIRHEGKLHDRASYRYHWLVLQRAHLSGAALPEEARRTFFDGEPTRPAPARG